MIWHDHSKLKDKHAFLGASNNYWLNDNPEELQERYIRSFLSSIGTLLHEYACKRIHYNLKLHKYDCTGAMFYILDKGIDKSIINRIDFSEMFINVMNYVNDAIGFRMQPEQILYYSDNSFGTADTISFRDNVLRIHDLKTGSSSVKIEQLEVYAGLFCLEYGYKPNNIDIVLRIYQNGDIIEHLPTSDEIEEIINKIVLGDATLNDIIGG